MEKKEGQAIELVFLTPLATLQSKQFKMEFNPNSA